MRFPGFRYDGKTKTASFEFTTPGTGGKKRRRKTVRNVTRDEALEAWKRWKDRLDAETPKTAQTFGGYVEQFWPAISARGAASSAKTESYILRRHLLPRFAGTQLARVNAAEVRDLVTALKTAGLSGSTINHATGLLLRILRDAVERDVLEALPVRGRIHLQKTDLLRLEMSPDEQGRFLRAFEDFDGFRRWIASRRTERTVQISSYYDRARPFGGSIRDDSAAAEWYFERFAASGPVFVLALETGLRRGDLLRLTWKNVDLEGGWIRIVTAKRKEPATIPVSARCRAALEKLRSRPRSHAGTVCVSLDGSPYGVTTVIRYFVAAKAVAEITRRLRFHDLRHTFASDLISSGVPEPFIRKALGQRGLTALARYARTREESLRVVADALDKKGGKI